MSPSAEVGLSRGLGHVRGTRDQDPFRGIRAAISGDTNCHLDRVTGKSNLGTCTERAWLSCGEEMGQFRLCRAFSEAAQPWRFMYFGHTGTLHAAPRRRPQKSFRSSISDLPLHSSVGQLISRLRTLSTEIDLAPCRLATGVPPGAQAQLQFSREHREYNEGKPFWLLPPLRALSYGFG